MNNKNLTTEEYAILKELTIQEIDIYKHSKSSEKFYDILIIINEKLEKIIKKENKNGKMKNNISK